MTGVQRGLHVAAVVLLACTVPAIAARVRPGTRTDHAAEVDALFARWNTGRTPGAAVLVVDDRKVVLKKGYGLADLTAKRPIAPDTAFLLASVTKQFTAMAVMMLAERGQLAFDDSLTRFFPAFETHAGRVTVRHLLNHLGGFPEYDDLFVQSGKVDRDWPRSAATKRSAFEPTARDALELLATQPLHFAPGERFEYSNSGYVILAQIVEHVSGKRFADYLRDAIFAPLGMKRSLLYDERRPALRHTATSYALENGVYRDIDYTPLNAIYGEDNIYSTVEDLYKWDQALYDDRLLNPAAIRQAFVQARLNDGTTTDYGFGWRVKRFLGLATVGHSGSWVGFRTSILRFPDQRFTVIVLSNCAALDAPIMAGKIARIYLAAQLTLPRAIVLQPVRMEEYAGRYELAPGAVAKLALDDGALWITPPGQEKMKLLAETPDHWFVEGSEFMSLTFQRDAGGTISGFKVDGGGSARRLR